MPSMKCHECGKVRQCSMVLEEPRSMAEGERPLILYMCKPCKREWDKTDQEEDSNA